jgi:cell division protein FtsL
MSTIEIQFDKKIDNSRVIRELDLRCRSDYICITLLGAVFVLGTLFYAWQQFQWIQYGYRIEAAGRQIDELAMAGRRLRIERASLASPRRIEQIARRQLGMVTPGVQQYVTLDKGGSGGSGSAPALVALGERSRGIGP